MKERLSSAGIALSVVSAATVIAVTLRSSLATVNLAMIYMLGAVVVATRWDRFTTVLTGIAGVAAFDYFCIPPYLTFAVADSEYAVTFSPCWPSVW